jgi:hypothetical protein
MIRQRKDTNEREIINAYQGVGAYARQMDRKAGFDLLVFFRGVVYVVEVKYTTKHKTRAELIKMLTANEFEAMQLIESTGADYNIVQNITEALSVIAIDTGTVTR